MAKCWGERLISPSARELPTLGGKDTGRRVPRHARMSWPRKLGPTLTASVF